jgi:hypothetical protein
LVPSFVLGVRGNTILGSLWELGLFGKEFFPSFVAAIIAKSVRDADFSFGKLFTNLAVSRVVALGAVARSVFVLAAIDDLASFLAADSS